MRRREVLRSALALPWGRAGAEIGGGGVAPMWFVVGMTAIQDPVTSQHTGRGVETRIQLMTLASFEGSWVAVGNGFSSRLTYEWALPGVLLRSRNELRNQAGERFGRYEGNYAWDPALSRIVFWTVGQDGELHRGEAEWREGQLWHQAAVSGGKIRGYRSVIRTVGNELHYRAKYEQSAADSDVLASTPLVYRRSEP